METTAFSVYIFKNDMNMGRFFQHLNILPGQLVFRINFMQNTVITFIIKFRHVCACHVPRYVFKTDLYTNVYCPLLMDAT